MQRNRGGEVYDEAQRVLRSLLIGIDPETMSQLTDECVTSRPMVKLALALGVEALETKYWGERWKQIERASDHPGGERLESLPKNHSAVLTDGPARAGSGWSSEEDQQLKSEFFEGKKFNKIATMHQRSRGAIVSRLVHLGLMIR